MTVTKERKAGGWGSREILAYWRSKERVLPLRITTDDVAILTVHWSVVPDYDYASVTQGQTDEDVRREVEIDWSATTGLRIYPQFNRQIHVASAPLAFDPRAPLYCGWDFGGTPAFVPTQLNAYGQWLIFPSLSPPENETLGTYEFGEMVQQFLHDEFAEPRDLTVDRLRLVHYGDPAGAGPPAHTGDRPREMRSHFDIIRRGVEIVVGHDERGKPLVERKPGFGWFIKPGAVDITQRLESVRARLTKLTPNGYPSLVVDPAAHVIIEGFGGGYCRRQRADGRYDHDPFKNWYCVDTATEILTPGGWRRYDELSAGDVAIGVDLVTHRLRSTTVAAVNVFDGEIPVTWYGGRKVDMVLTADHQCLVNHRVCSQSSSRWDEWKFVPAKDLRGQHHLITAADGCDQDEVLSDDLVRVCAWVMTEGTYCPRGGIVVSQSERANPTYCADLDDLMSRFGATAQASRSSRGMRAWRIGVQLEALVKSWMPDKYPSWEMVASLTPRQRRLFLYEALRGDGCGWGRGKNGPLPSPSPMINVSDFFVRSGVPRLYQKLSRKDEMGRLQAMGTLAGLDVSLVGDDKGKAPRYSLVFRRPAKRGVAVSQLVRVPCKRQRVWCPTTETGTWVARRGGRVFLTGNSHTFDALGYVATRLFHQVRNEKGWGDEDEQPQRHVVRSHAAGRNL